MNEEERKELDDFMREIYDDEPELLDELNNQEYAYFIASLLN